MEEEGERRLKLLLRRYYRKGDSILEIGSGSGELLRELARGYGGELWGVDPHIPRRDVEGIVFADIPAEELSSLGRRFDLVFSIHSLHHFQDVDRFLIEMGEVLDPEGYCILVDFRRGAETGIPEHYYSLADIRRRIEAAGYRIEESFESPEHFAIVCCS